MTVFSQLPKPTQVNKFIPKNAFDSYCNTRQKKLFTEKVEKIRWTNKLSTETTNLQKGEVIEIECFDLVLREKNGIEELVMVIDKAIPYPILFSLFYGNHVKRVISQKHPNPNNEDNAVIDWTFTTDWKEGFNPINFDLRVDLDHVYKALCYEVSGVEQEETLDVNKIAKSKKDSRELNQKIERLQAKLKREKQFNKRVELNVELQKLLKNN